MKRCLFLLMILCSWVLNAQKIENLRAEAQGEKIIIMYDIQAIEGDRYDVSVYASHNNYLSPLQQVIGDVGNGMVGGSGKRIEWNAKSELGEFKGQLTFEVHAVVIAPFSLTHAPAAASRGKQLGLTWRGGDRNLQVKMELLKKGVVQAPMGSVNNSGSYSWSIPPKQELGKDYQVRLTNGKDVITTGPFAIKPKIPMMVKVPLAAVAVFAIIVSLPKKSSGQTTKDEILANPPDLGLN